MTSVWTCLAVLRSFKLLHALSAATRVWEVGVTPASRICLYTLRARLPCPALVCCAMSAAQENGSVFGGGLGGHTVLSTMLLLSWWEDLFWPWWWPSVLDVPRAFNSPGAMSATHSNVLLTSSILIFHDRTAPFNLFPLALVVA